MITLALIGVGKWGINFLSTIEKMNNCRIKYIAANSKKSLMRFSNKYIKTTNYKDLLNHDDVDGIIVATPASTHYQIIKQLALSEVHILIEKPITIKYKDVLNLKKILKGKNSNIMVGHTYLYNPAYLKIKKMIPKIGQIRYMSFKGYNFGPFRDDMSALWEWAPHGVSIYLDILDTVPVEVSAWALKTLRPNTELYDNFFARLKFKNGLDCLIECGWLYPIKRRELIIYGLKSTILLDDLADKKITLYKNLGPTVKDENILKHQAKINYPNYRQITPLELEIEQFIEFISGKKEPKTNLDHAIAVAAVIDAAERSLNSNGKLVALQ